MIAVGPGAPNKEGVVMPTSVNAGDRVLLPGWGGNSIKVGEEVCNANPVMGGFVLNGVIRNITYSRTRKSWPRFKNRRIRAHCPSDPGGRYAEWTEGWLVWTAAHRQL